MKKKRPPRCDIALLVDEETGEHRPSGGFVPDVDDVEDRVARALRRRYRRVEVVPFLPSVVETVTRLRRLKPRVVFNLTEWVDGDRKLDAAIAGLLDMMRLRYTGTGPDGLTLARDKVLSKRIVGGLGVAVPDSFGLTGRSRGVPLRFPLVVKPRFGDGSDGIARASVVRSARELRARARTLHARTRDAVICEEYVPGRDLYVGLLGAEPAVLPPVELVVRSRRRTAPQIATYRVKSDPRYRRKWGVHYRRARLDPRTREALESASRRIFHALKLRGYARLDFRLTDEGRLYFIEANPNPDLDPHALNRSGCFAGVPYDRLLERIVESARRRGRRGDRTSLERGTWKDEG
jgi:D-alanine-D-alanine ligase